MFVSLSLLALLAAAPGADDGDLTAVLDRVDDLHQHRDEPGKLAEEKALVASALGRAPGDARVLWRAARLHFWIADDGSLAKELRSQEGKKGWDLAEKAIAARPGEAAGYYYAAINMGAYAYGLGVVKAISQGIDGKFRERLQQAERLDPRFDHGGIDVAWGRYFDKLPWPKHDVKKSEEHYRKALAVNPASVRARVYWAQLRLDEGHADDAKRLLDEVRAAKPGRYDAPEERRAKLMAAWLLPKVMEKMK